MGTAIVNARCGSCTFFDPIHTPASVGVYESQTEEARPVMLYGVCRRYPPRASIIEQKHPDLLDTMGRWPLVPDDLWCGEWKEELA
jgi:hypothetical protein